MEKLPFFCSVVSGSASVNFWADVDLYHFFTRRRFTDFYPACSCQKELGSSSFSVKYRNENSRSIKFSRNRKQVVVEYPWEMLQEGGTLFHLAYPLLESQHQKMGIVTTHCAAFSFEQKGYLLLGGQGAGKTSVLVEMCRKKNGKLISNNLCLVGGSNRDNIGIEGGNKPLWLRHESVIRSLPDLRHLFEANSNNDSWSRRLTLLPEDLDIQVETQWVPLSGAFLLHIDESQNGLFVRREYGLDVTLMLNENFSRYIRSTCTTVLGGDLYEMLTYLPPLDTENLFTKRRSLINFLVNEVGIYYISGNLANVVSFIEEQIK